MSASLVNRSLTNLRTELEFLKESNVISDQTYDMINNSLPQKYNPNESKDSLASGNNKGSEYVEALYRFEAQQEGDLALNPGDKVEVLEKPSHEWFKGRSNGKVGMFPANYVKPVFSGSDSSSRPNVPPPPQYEAQRIQSQQSSSSYQQPLPYPPPSTNYYQQPPQQQQQQQQQQQPQQEQHHHNHLKNFGSKLGNAAIFGAGATMGSDLINSIF